MVACVKGKLVEAVRGIGEPAGQGSGAGAGAGPMLDGEEDDRVGARARALVAAWKQQAKQHKALKSNKPPRLPQSPPPVAAAAAAATASKASKATTGAGSAQPVPPAASKPVPAAGRKLVPAATSAAALVPHRQTSSSQASQANGQLPGRSPTAASSVQSLLQAAAERQRKDKHKEMGNAHGHASAFAGTGAKASQAAPIVAASSAPSGPAPLLHGNGRGRQGGGGRAPGADGRPSGEAVLAAAMQCASQAVRRNQPASHGSKHAGVEGGAPSSGVLERLVQGRSREDVE